MCSEYAKKGFITLSLLGIASLAAAQTRQPNVVIIMTDQQTFNMMSCEGNRFLSTPNMDRLAGEGYRFQRTYAANPVSQPSRYALFTGRFSSDVGVRKNTTNPTETDKTHTYDEQFGMGYVFTRGGYDAIYVGKTHFYLGSGSLGFKRISSEVYDGLALKAEEFFPTRVGNPKPYLAVFSFLNPHDICLRAGIGMRFNDPAIDQKLLATNHYLDIKKAMSPEEYRSQIPPLRPNMAPIEKQISQVTDMSIGVKDFTRDDWHLYNWMLPPHRERGRPDRTGAGGHGQDRGVGEHHRRLHLGPRRDARLARHPFQERSVRGVPAGTVYFYMNILIDT